jgi:hypothetical protein
MFATRGHELGKLANLPGTPSHGPAVLSPFHQNLMEREKVGAGQKSTCEGDTERTRLGGVLARMVMLIGLCSPTTMRITNRPGGVCFAIPRAASKPDGAGLHADLLDERHE